MNIIPSGTLPCLSGANALKKMWRVMKTNVHHWRSFGCNLWNWSRNPKVIRLSDYIYIHPISGSEKKNITDRVLSVIKYNGCKLVIGSRIELSMKHSFVGWVSARSLRQSTPPEKVYLISSLHYRRISRTFRSTFDILVNLPARICYLVIISGLKHLIAEN